MRFRGAATLVAELKMAQQTVHNRGVGGRKNQPVAESLTLAYYQFCVIRGRSARSVKVSAFFFGVPNMFARLLCGWLICGFCLLQAISSSRAQESKDFELRMIANSKTFSQVTAINSKLQVLGSREVLEGDIGQLKNYFRSGEEDVELSLPKGFTNIEPLALSESGIVVGYVSRALGNPEGTLRGFYWDSQSRVTTLLEPLPTDVAGLAHDISADGKRITGFSTGSEPPRVRPCVWQWNEQSKKYVPEELSTIIANNPFLQASQVIISPNGKRIAACITEKQISQFIFDSSLFVWEQSESGEWIRKKLSDDQPKLKDMNDTGTIVGTTSGEGRARACWISPEGKIELIDLLEGDDSNTAYGINNAGTIVGLSDDPTGTEGSSEAFIWEKGVVSPLRLLRGSESESAALAINQEGAIAGFMYKEAGENSSIVAFIRIKKSQ